MKTLKICLLILLSLLVLSSCSDKPNGDDKIPEFAALDSSILKPEDLDMSIELCKSLMLDSYLAKEDPAKIDLTRYIVDPNLLKYSIRKLEQEAHNLAISEIIIELVEAQYLESHFILKLSARVKQLYGGEFGEGFEFLVTNSNGRLIIADWFTPMGTMSSFDRQHRGDLGITYPTIWEDPETVKDLFRSAGIE